MTEHYVTLFDSLFLPQGVALHASLRRHAGDFTLWILCMDDRAQQILERLALPGVRLIPIAQAETEELRRVKPTRSRGEYCWTITPFTPRMVFERDPSVQRVTYVDADLWFRQAPQRLLAEFETTGKAVQITEHGYAPEYDFAGNTGRFCVQFMTFVRERSERVREWWADRCIEWCFARLDEGRFGDQKYLDDWPERFAGDVHVLSPADAIQGPWNASRRAPSRAVAYHFHGLRLLARGRVLTMAAYALPRSTRETIYEPYLDDLGEAVRALRAVGWEPPPQMQGRWWAIAWAERVRRIVSSLRESMRSRVARLR